MRVSVGDPDTRTARTWLNGTEVTKQCVEADTDKGYVMLLRKGAGGNILYDYIDGGTLTVTHFGNVAILYDNKLYGSGLLPLAVSIGTHGMPLAPESPLETPVHTTEPGRSIKLKPRVLPNNSVLE